MLKKHSDKKLIEGIRKGEDKSVNYLYNSLFSTVKSYILKNRGTEDDAYDVFQDAMMVLFKKVQQNHLGKTTDVRGYLFGVSRNLWHERLRKQNIHVESIDEDIIESDDVASLLETPIEQIVQRSFLKLKPDCRKVLNMSIKGIDYDEIAKKMNYKSAEYARRKKHLCKEALLKIIKSDPDYGEYSGN